jgi:hypothetical protein
MVNWRNSIQQPKSVQQVQLTGMVNYWQSGQAKHSAQKWITCALWNTCTTWVDRTTAKLMQKNPSQKPQSQAETPVWSAPGRMAKQEPVGLIARGVPHRAETLLYVYMYIDIICVYLYRHCIYICILYIQCIYIYTLYVYIYICIHCMYIYGGWSNLFICKSHSSRINKCFREPHVMFIFRGGLLLSFFAKSFAPNK